MPRRFRTFRSRRFPFILFAFGLAAACAMLYELYRVIVPFQSANPLWHEATIGEPVIDGWLYDGEDEAGYLRFYNGSQYVVIPPNSHTFDADGQFVVLEHATPNSLTFAEPYEAIPLSWLAAGFAVVAGAVGLWLRARRVKRRGTFVRKTNRTLFFFTWRVPGLRRSRFRARTPRND